MIEKYKKKVLWKHYVIFPTFAIIENSFFPWLYAGTKMLIFKATCHPVLWLSPKGFKQILS